MEKEVQQNLYIKKKKSKKSLVATGVMSAQKP